MDLNGRLGDQSDLFLTPACGIELALLRARPAFDAGWQLTPSEALTLFGEDTAASFPTPGSLVETEDEIEDIPGYFSARFDDE